MFPTFFLHVVKYQMFSITKHLNVSYMYFHIALLLTEIKVYLMKMTFNCVANLSSVWLIQKVGY